MPRKEVKIKKRIQPLDKKYGSKSVSKLINFVTQDGNKYRAKKIVYGSFDIIEEQTKKNPIDIFAEALKNVTIKLMTKSRRIGAVNYQIPVEVPAALGVALGMKNIVKDARGSRRNIPGKDKTIVKSLAIAIMNAASGVGQAIKERDKKHKEAEANKANARYRW